MDTVFSSALVPDERPRRLNPLAWPVAPHPDDEDAFWQHRLAEGVQSWRMLLLFGSIVTVAWWPTDPWIFARSPDALGVFVVTRGFAAVASVAMFLLVVNVPAFRARPYFAMA